MNKVAVVSSYLSIITLNELKSSIKMLRKDLVDPENLSFRNEEER
jgi:hypothetical protein